MKHMKKTAAVALSAAALSAALLAGSASATTLEVGGVAKNQSVTILASLKAGTSLILKDTFGISIKTCTTSSLHGATSSPFTGGQVTVPLSSLSVSNCDRTALTDDPGTLHIQWTSGTNGTVTSSKLDITTNSPFGTLTCTTGAGTHLGSLTGVASSSAHATIDINASISCSGISSKWEATYTITTPTGLGVVS
jgi:hypothetical protein